MNCQSFTLSLMIINAALFAVGFILLFANYRLLKNLRTKTKDQVHLRIVRNERPR